jgi:mono/diheme cytochrome c family protein
MRPSTHPWPLAGAAILFSLLAAAPAATAEPVGSAGDLFERTIRPLLVDKCYSCHSAEAKKLKGKFRLDTYAGLLAGGESGKPAVVPGKPEASPLVAAIRATDPDAQMPPKERLTDQAVADVVSWIAKGAPHPDAGRTPVPVVKDAAAKLEEAKRFWSFQPVRMPVVPQAGAGWAVNDIDHFIAAGHAARQLKPAPEADRRTLIRRATFDLTGLPPTAAEVDAFLADTAPDAYDRLVERLLAAPAYGERWGRHWLDVARYADTAGESADYPVPQMWRYRNYVINAINQDRPYDQFVREQIAGDLLPARDEAQHHEFVTATGYLAIARRFSVDPENDHHLTIEDTIDTMGRSLMGLSLSCARCHDHKFDPIPTSDYYALYGIFASTRYPFPGAENHRYQHSLVPLCSDGERDRLLGDKRERVAAIDAEFAQMKVERDEAWKIKEEIKKAKAEGREPPKEPRDHNTLKEAMAKLMKERAQILDELPEVPMAFAVAEGNPHNERIQQRGERWKQGDEVPRRFLTVLGGQQLPEGSKGSGRLELAGWITSASNPLTPRVLVNRVWHWHFGRGIVPTTSDFGVRGQPPANPALLDWLAARFMADGWSLKKLHRLVMTSRTYRQAWVADDRQSGIDADNAYVWRFTRQRLEAEEIRDALLAVSGNLDRAMPAAHAFPRQSTWGWTQHNPLDLVLDTSHRSIYVMQQRIKKHPFFEIFDGADTNLSTGERLASTTPLQALFLLNDPFVFAQAEGVARHVAAAGDAQKQVQALYREVLARQASEAEARAGSAYLARFQALAASKGMPADAALASYARTLFAGNEFMFVE